MHYLRNGSTAVLAVTIAALAAAPVRAQLTSADRAALDELGPTYAQRFVLRRGWYRGVPVRYFDIGPAALTAAPVYVFVTGVDAQGQPQVINGQQPVLSSIPGVENYSGIWQVVFVVVPPSWTANAVREARAIVGMALRGEARFVIPNVYVNWPVVPAGSTLEDDPADLAPRTAWYQGRDVTYYDFGRSPLAPAPIYPLITGDSAGTPLFVPGQANIVDVVPLPGVAYMDMWDVHLVTVSAGYVADTWRDLATLEREAAAGRVTIRRVGQIRNCPVVLVDGRLAARIPLFR